MKASFLLKNENGAAIVSLVAVGAVAKLTTPALALIMQPGNQTGGNIAEDTTMDPIQLGLALRDFWVDHVV